MVFKFGLSIGVFNLMITGMIFSLSQIFISLTLYHKYIDIRELMLRPEYLYTGNSDLPHGMYMIATVLTTF